ncbi:prepilin-type N-terminal cleavage/methylation domain-containing protein [Nitratiruptor sp. YY09-18]|uniref:prepilin-type N-terminal cleavage/methylation domain-containing protein n=1 Tax=Nitratiruptor sp. YY09-18 TaxID=2724901 RepID=UPI00191660B8|nr:prepilin-type N-terminal cleavage/methylation domain-containing protein [Nitratiruptor sp. YY09-18]BCD68678.1 hypothetical protein NitYY0918_C1595 [Nitratiruptor sp. YY09-18]
MEKVTRRAFTLIEIVVVVVIIAILSVASYKAMQAIIVRSFKAKEMTRLSLESQIALDIISSYMQDRIPASVIGYDPASGNFAYIDEIPSTERYPVLEWLAFDELNRKMGKYIPFVDMVASLANSDYTLETTISLSGGADYGLVFAKSFDRATTSNPDAFGWHGRQSQDVYDVAFGQDKITITDSIKPQWIYEKYYLVKTAYAIARGADIKQDAGCIQDLNISDINNTLLLFYDYRPWKSETFCADPHGNAQGKVTVLARDISGFEVSDVNQTMRIYLDVSKKFRGTDVGVHFGKMKVVF